MYLIRSLRRPICAVSESYPFQLFSVFSPALFYVHRNCSRVAICWMICPEKKLFPPVMEMKYLCNPAQVIFPSYRSGRYNPVSFVCSLCFFFSIPDAEPGSDGANHDGQSHNHGHFVADSSAEFALCWRPDGGRWGKRHSGAPVYRHDRDAVRAVLGTGTGCTTTGSGSREG